MVDALRTTGIPSLGHVPWGTHFCLFYETRQDLLDLLIPYFKAGLESHEFCLCVASEPIVADEVERHHQFSAGRRHGAWERLEGSELQKAHAEIRRLNANLERRVEERTAELAAANQRLVAEIAERQRAEERLRLVINTIPAMVF